MKQVSFIAVIVSLIILGTQAIQLNNQVSRGEGQGSDYIPHNYNEKAPPEEPHMNWRMQNYRKSDYESYSTRNDYCHQLCSKIGGINCGHHDIDCCPSGSGCHRGPANDYCRDTPLWIEDRCNKKGY